MAPEQFAEVKQGYSTRTDMWSLGCIAIEVFAGRRAFKNILATQQHFLAKKTPRSLVTGLSEATKRLVQDLFKLDPEERPSARNLFKRVIEGLYSTYDETPKDPGIRPHKRPRTGPHILGLDAIYQSIKWAFDNNSLGLLNIFLAGSESAEAYPPLTDTNGIVDDSSQEREAFLASFDDANLLTHFLLGPPHTDAFLRSLLEKAIHRKQFKKARNIAIWIRSEFAREPNDTISGPPNFRNLYMTRSLIALLEKAGFTLSVARHLKTIETLYAELGKPRVPHAVLVQLLPAEFKCEFSCNSLVAVLRPERASRLSMSTMSSAELGRARQGDPLQSVSFNPAPCFDHDGGTLYVFLATSEIRTYKFILQSSGSHTTIIYFLNKSLYSRVYSAEDGMFELELPNPMMHNGQEKAISLCMRGFPSGPEYFRLDWEQGRVHLKQVVSPCGRFIAYLSRHYKERTDFLHLVCTRTGQVRDKWGFEHSAITADFSSDSRYLCTFRSFLPNQTSEFLLLNIEHPDKEPLYFSNLTRPHYLPTLKFLPGKPLSFVVIWNTVNVGEGFSLELVDFSTFSCRSLLNFTFPDETISFSFDGSFMASWSPCRGEVRMWTTHDWRLQYFISLPKSAGNYSSMLLTAVMHVIFHPSVEERLVVIVEGDGNIRALRY
jgi:hypothetical protein